MPLILTGTPYGSVVVLSAPVILTPSGTTVSTLAGIPEDPSATFIDIQPPLGARASLQPPAIPPALIVHYAGVPNVGLHKVTVTLTEENSMAPIFYTKDGTAPTRSSTAYSGPFDIIGTAAQVITLKFKAFAIEGLGFIDSETYSVPVTIP